MNARTLDEHRAAARDGMRAALEQWHVLARQVHPPRGLAAMRMLDWHLPRRSASFDEALADIRALDEALAAEDDPDWIEEYTRQRRAAVGVLLTLDQVWVWVWLHVLLTALATLIATTHAAVTPPRAVPPRAAPAAPRAPAGTLARVA